MKKVIVGSIAIILLLSGCSKSAKECREETMELSKLTNDPEAMMEKIDELNEDCAQYR